MPLIKVLIIEDEILEARRISNQLEDFGYDVIDIIDNGEDALEIVRSILPDLIIMDIGLRGDIDGVETAKKINKILNVPIIYLTALSDDKTLYRALKTNYDVFLNKPSTKQQLFMAIENALSNKPKLESNSDWIFVKKDTQSNTYEKVEIKNILFFKADNQYHFVVTKTKKYHISFGLNNVFSRVNNPCFFRISKSHIVNILHVNSIEQNIIRVGEINLIVSKDKIKGLKNRLLLYRK